MINTKHYKKIFPYVNITVYVILQFLKIFQANAGEGEALGTYNRVAVHSYGALTPTYKTLLEDVYRANVTEIASTRNIPVTRKCATNEWL